MIKFLFAYKRIKEKVQMKDFKILFDYFKEHKIAALAVIIATSMSAGVGAIFGAMAFYNGWLG